MIYVYVSLASLAALGLFGLGWYAHYKLGVTVERIEALLAER